MCRLSCTATLILSINNNPPHCRPGPHLLITICHLSDTTPLPSTPSASSPPASHPKLCSPPLRPSQQGQLSSAPPPPRPASPPPPQPVSTRVQPRDMVQHTEGCSLTLPCLTLTYFNCTGEGVEFIRKYKKEQGREALEILIGEEGTFTSVCLENTKMRIYYHSLE